MAAGTTVKMVQASSKPTLYLVATPIGNLEDITLRALRVLQQVALVAAEDTRTTRHLLTAHGIQARLISFHRHNWRHRLPRLLEHLAEADLALVSEAGTPGLSDPGYELVVAAIQAGIPVVPVPGPSALLSALAVSGLPMAQFHFLGYLPRRPGERRRALAAVVGEPGTLVFFEAPHRLRECLQDILQVLGDRRLAAARELTKLYEETFRGSVTEALAYFEEPLGEFTLVVEGSTEAARPKVDMEMVERELRRCRERGLPPGEAVREVSRSLGLPRNRVYQAWLRLG